MTPVRSSNQSLQGKVILALSPTISGKIRRLRMFPGHAISARLRIARIAHRWRTRRAEAEMASCGLDRLLERRSGTALSQDPADLMFLYRSVRKRAVRRAIEFGSGQSTLFIAQALHDNGAGHLWSLDADEHWLDHTRQMLPERLRPYVTLIHSPVIVNSDYGVPAWQYGRIPDGEWDFVFIDGPAAQDGISTSCDLVLLEPQLRPGAFGMIDHRWRTAALAQEATGGRLRLRYIPSLESFVFSVGRA